jgi:molybdate transport system regulatory protein
MVLALSIYPAISKTAMNLPHAPRLVGRLEVATELGSFLGDTRIRLLEAIERHGSISQAAKAVPLSYKAAWDALDAMNNLSDQPLVQRVAGGRQGGGTQLTAHGRRLIALYRAMECEYQAALDRLVQQLADTEGEVSVRGFQQLMRRLSLRTSARNQLACTVNGLREGDVDCEVVLGLDEQTALKAVITRESAQSLELATGMQVLALVKSSSVLLMTERGQRLSADNQLWGTVSRVYHGPVNSEVRVDIGGGRTVVSVVTHESVAQLGLAEGSAAAAVFQASNVILSVIG